MTFYEDESRGTKQNVNHNFCYICYMLRCLFTSHLGRQVCRYMHTSTYTQITVALCTTFNQKGAKNFVQTFHPFLHWKKAALWKLSIKILQICNMFAPFVFKMLFCTSLVNSRNVPRLNKIRIRRDNNTLNNKLKVGDTLLELYTVATSYSESGLDSTILVHLLSMNLWSSDCVLINN